MHRISLRIALPNKGRLSDRSVELLEAAGVRIDAGSDRRLFATGLGGRMKLLFARAQDIPAFVERGAADVGITGWDIVQESGADVEDLLDLGFGSCRLVLALPKDDDEGLRDGMRVATSFPNLTRAFFDDKGLSVEVVPVSGAAEATPHLGVADAIVDLTSSGATLEMNQLEPVETLLESSARLVANGDALQGPDGEALRELAFALESVVAARGKKYLMADIPEDVLSDASELLPGIEGPTVVPIDKEGWVAIQVVVDEDDVYDKIHALKKLGAKGILVVPIERLVP